MTHHLKTCLAAALIIAGTGCTPALGSIDRQRSTEIQSGPVLFPPVLPVAPGQGAEARPDLPPLLEAGVHTHPALFPTLEPAPSAPALPMIWQFR